MAHKLGGSALSIKLLSSGVSARRTTQISIDLRIDIPEPRCSESAQPVWFHCWTKPPHEQMKTNASPEPTTLATTRNTANTATPGDTTTGCTIATGDTLRLRKTVGPTGWKPF
jgi:hypothetical protein